MNGDSGTLKGYWARNTAVSDAAGIAHDMGLEFVRTLTASDMMEMAGDQLDRETGRSFRRADLVIEATPGTGPRTTPPWRSLTPQTRGTQTGRSGTPGSCSRE